MKTTLFCREYQLHREQGDYVASTCQPPLGQGGDIALVTSPQVVLSKPKLKLIVIASIASLLSGLLFVYSCLFPRSKGKPLGQVRRRLSSRDADEVNWYSSSTSTAECGEILATAISIQGEEDFDLASFEDFMGDMAGAKRQNQDKAKPYTSTAVKPRTEQAEQFQSDELLVDDAPWLADQRELPSHHLLELLTPRQRDPAIHYLKGSHASFHLPAGYAASEIRGKSDPSLMDCDFFEAGSWLDSFLDVDQPEVDDWFLGLVLEERTPLLPIEAVEQQGDLVSSVRGLRGAPEERPTVGRSDDSDSNESAGEGTTGLTQQLKRVTQKNGWSEGACVRENGSPALLEEYEPLPLPANNKSLKTHIMASNGLLLTSEACSSHGELKFNTENRTPPDEPEQAKAVLCAEVRKGNEAEMASLLVDFAPAWPAAALPAGNLKQKNDVAKHLDRTTEAKQWNVTPTRTEKNLASNMIVTETVQTEFVPQSSEAAGEHNRLSVEKHETEESSQGVSLAPPAQHNPDSEMHAVGHPFQESVCYSLFRDP
ncbi:hypothetical protein, conserved [Eimeria tenella]|uniref:Transmembrane protein n=1 Tax=Eimeria tenella TaxID=5802 RepID=U6L0P2_EIMTE|nr:hypothetical protein, conserved [Eimeria tenella]CDJ41335.1 hypothetical protein, conserved [Eimeria tenella]|eukprot:XP_013232085.1 hypothetical protein, conserved [Eimeria tenella]